MINGMSVKVRLASAPKFAESEYNSLGVNSKHNLMNCDGGILAVMAKGNIINLHSM